MTTKIKNSITVPGISDVAQVQACDFVVSGPFVGAWRMTMFLNDEWVTIRRGSTPVEVMDQRFALRRQVRFEVDEISSGAVTVSLDGRDFNL